MPVHSEEELDFAYKYPFSEEAKAIIRELDMRKVEQRHLQVGVARLESALSGELPYTAVGYGKLDYLVGYVYARMLLSCMKSEYAVGLFSGSEAKRCAAAMKSEQGSGIVRIAKALGIDAKETGQEFSVSFAKVLENMPKGTGYSLANLQLSKGAVVLNKKQLIDVMAEAVKRSVAKGLPVGLAGVPSEVKAAAKALKVPFPKATVRLKGGDSIAWIDKLLEVPIPDCRHRTVNLILAPYLMTIKGMEVEDGMKVISAYIEKCKLLNPHTNVNESYIRYQCRYAKSHGMKPMTLIRAKGELSAIDFRIISGEE
jgi:hypothetical protein